MTPPKAMAPTPEGTPGMAGGMPGGFDPSQLDPQMMMQFTQALQRLPKGQLQKLQGIMQRAMSGKDVSREATEFEHSLPKDLQELMKTFATQMPGMGIPGMGSGQDMIDVDSTSSSSASSADNSGMTEEQARAIVAAAAADGKISRDEAEKLLVASSSGTDEEKKTGFAKFWRGISGKDT
jgi:hypothetical protein